MISRSFYFSLCLVTVAAYAQSEISPEKGESPSFLTGQDAANHSLSNITLINRTNQPINVYGLFIATYDINDCSSCTGNVVSGDNLLGAVVQPVFFNVNQSIPIGQNYLYNMLYNGLYALNSQSITPPCLLPGCSWPGDTPIQGWCLNIGALSLHSNYTYSFYAKENYLPASIVPFTEAATNVAYNYNYDLINPELFGNGAACIGPITCNDQSLTCSVRTPQSQSFQPYT